MQKIFFEFRLLNEELGKIQNSEFGIQRGSGAKERGCHTDLYFANAKYGCRL